MQLIRRTCAGREIVGEPREVTPAGVVSSCGGGPGVGEVAVVDGDGGGHDPLAVGSDAVETPPGDLGDEAVAAELVDETAGSLAASAGFGVVGGRWRGSPGRSATAALRDYAPPLMKCSQQKRSAGWSAPSSVTSPCIHPIDVSAAGTETFPVLT